ncbi:MAG: zinc-ribbon domain-containing protein [Clostridia bacterium]|nr:zinc-ribbon domain-containing protein [Clostridia bacterium]
MAKLNIGVNNLAAGFPALATEWHPTKNGTLTPRQVTPNSHKKIWWRCSNGHEWKTSVNNRTSLHRGCPECSKKSRLNRSPL